MCSLGDAEATAKLDGGDALLRLGHVIDRQKPQRQRQLGGMEQGTGGQRYLVAAGLALIEPAPGDLAMARCATARADEAAGPTPTEQGLAALLLAAVKITKTWLAEPLLELNFVPLRLTQVQRPMGRALWAAAHTRLGRCPKPPSVHGVWGRGPQEAGGVWGATPLGAADSLS